MTDDYLVAVEDIRFGASGVLAYSRGQLVKADAVKENGWEDFVQGRNTKEARAALGLPEDPGPSRSATRARPGRPRNTAEAPAEDAAEAPPETATPEPSPEGTNAPEGGEEV